VEHRVAQVVVVLQELTDPQVHPVKMDQAVHQEVLALLDLAEALVQAVLVA
jgi:hypothetical protein